MTNYYQEFSNTVHNFNRTMFRNFVLCLIFLGLFDNLDIANPAKTIGVFWFSTLIFLIMYVWFNHTWELWAKWYKIGRRE